MVALPEKLEPDFRCCLPEETRPSAVDSCISDDTEDDVVSFAVILLLLLLLLLLRQSASCMLRRRYFFSVSIRSNAMSSTAVDKVCRSRACTAGDPPGSDAEMIRRLDSSSPIAGGFDGEDEGEARALPLLRMDEEEGVIESVDAPPLSRRVLLSFPFNMLNGVTRVEHED